MMTEIDLDSLVPRVENDEELQTKLTGLCKSAYRSLQLIEPWQNAHSNLSVVTKMIDVVKLQGNNYYAALDRSIKTSDDGYSISKECESLCGFLTQGASAHDLSEFIGEMRVKAKSAHQDAKATCELFRAVRRGLDQASATIPNAIQQLRDSNTPLESIMFLPEELKIDADKMEDSPQDLVPRREDRVTKPCNDQEARSHLFLASKMVEQLMSDVDTFANWWLHLDTKFSRVEGNVSKLNPNKIVKLNVEATKREWIRIKDIYLHYKTVITRLQDYFPKARHIQSRIPPTITAPPTVSPPTQEMEQITIAQPVPKSSDISRPSLRLHHHSSTSSNYSRRSPMPKSTTPVPNEPQRNNGNYTATPVNRTPSAASNASHRKEHHQGGHHARMPSDPPPYPQSGAGQSSFVQPEKQQYQPPVQNTYTPVGQPQFPQPSQQQYPQPPGRPSQSGQQQYQQPRQQQYPQPAQQQYQKSDQRLHNPWDNSNNRLGSRSPSQEQPQPQPQHRQSAGSNYAGGSSQAREAPPFRASYGGSYGSMATGVKSRPSHGHGGHGHAHGRGGGMNPPPQNQPSRTSSTTTTTSVSYTATTAMATATSTANPVVHISTTAERVEVRNPAAPSHISSTTSAYSRHTNTSRYGAPATPTKETQAAPPPIPKDLVHVENSIFARFKHASEQEREMKDVLVSAVKSFQIIEPWNAARSDHHEVQPLITSVQKQGAEYYRALDESILVVEKGYSFCSDSEDLCDFILDPEVSVAELQDFISSMRSHAKQAHDDAKRVFNMFSSIRQRLNEISVNALRAQQRVYNEGESAFIKASAADATMRAVQDTVLVARFIFLPAILPIFDPIFNMLTDQFTKGIKQEKNARIDEMHSCEDALKTLIKAVQDLEQLGGHVDKFSMWWLTMDTLLGHLESGVDQLRADHIVRLQLKQVKSKWHDAKDRYQGYKVNMCKLQDYYPSSRTLENGPVM